MNTFPWKTTLDKPTRKILVTINHPIEGERTLPFPSIETFGQWMEFDRFAEDYPNVPLIQDALPFLSSDEREFLISGTTPEEFNLMFEESE